MTVVFALAVFAAAAFMLYGWGWAARRILREKSAAWPTTAAAGMAAVVFMGGLLNLARIAYPWPLGCVAAAGIVLGVVAVAKDRPGKFEVTALAWFIVPVAVLIFTIVTQVPPRAYNFHDDFQKYFGHPVRMLETGTVFGSPLNDMGVDTLGGQAFLDGFAVAFFPIQYINGVDAALALFLCMMLASQFKNIVATLSVIFINPQYVNISSLYTGSFLMMAVIVDEGTGAAITGLLYAALAALKGTFALFVALHLAAAVFARGAKWTLRASAFAALFLAPWILVHAPHYLEVFKGAAPEFADHGVRPAESFNLFSTQPLDYGSTPLDYTGLMIAVGSCGLMLAMLKRKVDITAAACFAAIAAYLIMVYVSGPRYAGYAQAIRYFTPFAIGVAPVTFGAASLAFSRSTEYRWFPLVVAAVPVLMFAPSLRDRAEQALHSGSVLAFSWLAPDADYLEYNRQVLYGDVRQRVAAAQAKVPAGDEVVAWINAPFYLDYARNRIVDVEPGQGLVAPWSVMPVEVRYFMWEYRGYANMEEADYLEVMAEGPDVLRHVAAARLKLTRQLNEIMEHSEKLYDDGEIAVFRR
jgi:hypothetical protein